MTVAGPPDDDESTIDSDLPPPPQLPKAPRVPARAHDPLLSTRPIPRAHAPDLDDEGDFEGDDPPTTAEPVRDDHPHLVPRSPNIATRPVPKFRPGQPDDGFDDDAHPTMIDPHVPTGGVARPTFDPRARIDDHRRVSDLSSRALEPTSDLGPAARRALGQGAEPRQRDAMPTAPIRKTPLAAQEPLTTAPMGSGAIAEADRASVRRDGPRNPPSPTGPMLRPPPDAPPALPPGSHRASSQRASGPQRAIAPSPPPPFVADRRAAMGPPPDGAAPPSPLRAFAPPSSQAAPTMLQRPAPSFDPHGRIDDSSRTHRWEGRPAADSANDFATPYAQTDQGPAPMHAVSHKSFDDNPRPAYEHRPIPQVQIRSMADLSKTPPSGMGRLAPPHDPNQARTRKTQDVLIWGSIVVIIGSIVTLVIWLIAR